MHDIALNIKKQDWFYILIIGLFFGMFLSSLGYMLLEYPWMDGTLFGALLGFSITLFSLMFISHLNKNILPKVAEIYWVPLSMFFSFLSGFLGTFTGVFMAKALHIRLIPAFEEQITAVSFSIGVLTYIVGALLYRFVKMRNQKDHLDYEYVQSRLRSLETQLNPHFLFNALNSIAELIHQDKDKAEEAILKVSSFLRNSMNEKALLSLEDEVRNVKDYVALENIRFSQKIQLHTALLPHLWEVPKFSIQLLVENAIKHGFTQNHEALHIYLSFDEAQKSISVRNDGESLKSVKFGVGLSNLKQRLELLCNGSLEVEEQKEPTFTIYLGSCYEHSRS